MRLPTLAVGLLAGLAAIPAAGAGAVIPAVQDDALPNLNGAALDARLDVLAATGTRVTRVDVLWSRVATRRPAKPRDPNDPAYDWARYDAILRGLEARGIGAIVDFYHTPPWASRNGKPVTAPRTVDGARFAAALARRYSGAHVDAAGSPLPRVRRIEVWNEPNVAGFYQPQCSKRGRKVVLESPRRYAALLAASYREIKRASPATQVVGGVLGPAGRTPSVCAESGFSVGAVDFAARLARERPPLDAWSMHMYPIGSPERAFFVPSWNTLTRVLRHVDKLRGRVPVYITETGYHTSYNRFHRYFVSEEQQAAWVGETYRVAARHRRVQLAMWFNFQDNPFWTGGLLRADGSRKPSYAAFVRETAAVSVPADWTP